MPSVPKRVHVVKIPKPSNDSSSAAAQKVMPEFDRMPRMYLELLENKEKIRPHLVNKEYDPEDASSVYSFDLNPAPPVHARPAPTIERVVEENEEDDEDDDDVSEKNTEPLSSVGSGTEAASEAGSEAGSDAASEVASEAGSDILSGSSSGASKKSRGSRKSTSLSSARSSSSLRQPLTSKEEEVKNRTKEKLKELLFSEERQVPTLAELKKRGEVKESGVIADLGRVVDGERLEEEDELKRELLFKFELLKKSYKHVHVPEFTMHSDYRNMNQTYENTLRQVSLDSNVESYKSLLVGGFMLLEFILGFWMKFDMSGFTQQQILNMNQYERLLIELGEKSYVPGGSQWPVEIRLLGLIVMNAIIFIISKMILKKTGSNLVGLMNSVNTVMGGGASSQKPKRRMRGPSVELDAIPDVDGGGDD